MWECGRGAGGHAIATAKFYLFDMGVTHTLAGTKYLERKTDGIEAAMKRQPVELTRTSSQVLN